MHWQQRQPHPQLLKLRKQPRHALRMQQRRRQPAQPQQMQRRRALQCGRSSGAATSTAELRKGGNTAAEHNNRRLSLNCWARCTFRAVWWPPSRRLRPLPCRLPRQGRRPRLRCARVRPLLPLCSEHMWTLMPLHGWHCSRRRRPRPPRTHLHLLRRVCQSVSPPPRPSTPWRTGCTSCRPAWHAAVNWRRLLHCCRARRCAASTCTWWWSEAVSRRRRRRRPWSLLLMTAGPRRHRWRGTSCWRPTA